MDNDIRQRRAGLGWSQSALARRLEVSRQTVNAIENGRYDPSLPLAFKIAGVFGCTIEAVFHTPSPPAHDHTQSHEHEHAQNGDTHDA